jgi:hypothetical protein
MKLETGGWSAGALNKNGKRRVRRLLGWWYVHESVAEQQKKWDHRGGREGVASTSQGLGSAPF